MLFLSNIGYSERAVIVIRMKYEWIAYSWGIVWWDKAGAAPSKRGTSSEIQNLISMTWSSFLSLLSSMPFMCSELDSVNGDTILRGICTKWLAHLQCFWTLPPLKYKENLLRWSVQYCVSFFSRTSVSLLYVDFVFTNSTFCVSLLSDAVKISRRDRIIFFSVKNE